MRGLNADLSAAVSKVLDHDATPKGVHRLRTTIRRIESLVSYANPDIDKKLERSLEKMTDLRKRAGKVRDLDVQADLLATLGNGSTAKDRKTLADLLEKKRNRQAKRLESIVKKLRDRNSLPEWTGLQNRQARRRMARIAVGAFGRGQSAAC